MLSLRLVLIVISVLVVGGIYLLSRRRTRRRSMGRLIIEPDRERGMLRRLVPRRRDEEEVPDYPADEADGIVGPVRVRPAPGSAGGNTGSATGTRSAGNDDPLAILVQPPEVEDEQGPRVVNTDARGRVARESRRRRGRDAAADRGQLELGFDAPMHIDDSFEDEQEREPAPGRGKPAPPVRVIVFYVEVAEPRRIGGPALLDALRTVGLQHGEMRIFHHFGIGQMSSDESVFSVANMFEPGEFDLSKMHTISTRGVAMFMRLPTPLDAPVAFELMLNTAQRLAELLDAQVCDDDHRPLTAETIEEIREGIARDEHGIS